MTKYLQHSIQFFHVFLRYQKKIMQIDWPKNINQERFLKDYWQRRPLLMRRAFPDLPELVDEHELAGLACEADVESRLITENPQTGRFELEHGPFDAGRFENLPATHWTLLVQDVDKFVPQAARLLDCFRFLPAWRIDDLMISYATDQGGVGPHTDSYDVFLLQLKGRRHWRISEKTHDETSIDPTSPLRTITDFETTRQWCLEPGDMLYLPPQLAHWGVADGDCLTASIGFTSPTLEQLFSAWADHIGQQLPLLHYRDPLAVGSDEPYRITDQEISQVAVLLSQAIQDDSITLRNFFGELISQGKPGLAPSPREDADPVDRLWFSTKGINHYWVRHPAVRMFYHCDADGLSLFANGCRFRFMPEDVEFVRQLCEQRSFIAGFFQRWVQHQQALNCLVDLINSGCMLEAYEST